MRYHCPSCQRPYTTATTNHDRVQLWTDTYCEHGDTYYKHHDEIPFTPASEPAQVSLPAEDVVRVRERYETESAATIADDLGVSKWHVWAIANGHARTEVTA